MEGKGAQKKEIRQRHLNVLEPTQVGEISALEEAKTHNVGTGFVHALGVE